MAKKKLRCDIAPAYDQSAGKRYAAIPCAVTGCANFAKLSVHAKALLLDAATLFTGTNNGQICLALTIMKPLGWTNSRTLFNARRELSYYRFIRIYRPHTNRQPTLYELSWINIQNGDKARGLPATRSPSATYLVEKPKYQKPGKKKSIQSETVEMLRDGIVPKHTVSGGVH